MDDVMGMKVLQAVNDIDRQFAKLGTNDPIWGLFYEVVLKIPAGHKASYDKHGLIRAHPQHSYLLEFVSAVFRVNIVIWGGSTIKGELSALAASIFCRSTRLSSGLLYFFTLKDAPRHCIAYAF